MESKSCSKLLELAASDDIEGFIGEVQGKGFDVNEVSNWYGRRIGSKKMAFEERNPLMIAAMYGSTEALKYIIGTRNVDVNKTCGSDGATALHCAAAGGSALAAEVVKILLDASADIRIVDSNGNKPCDVIAPSLKPSNNLKRKELETMLQGGRGLSSVSIDEAEFDQNLMAQSLKERNEKKDYPVDVSLPDINSGIYMTDEFRMYSFKITPCSRAYSHDWTECPFAHPGENARRRDPKKYQYSCVPCPDFKKGTCAKGDTCEYAHGVFESWLHPAQYRTRLCKDEIGCSRKVCFFAHKHEELRPLYASTGSAMPSLTSAPVSSVDMASLSPLALGSSSMLLPTTAASPMSPSAGCSSPVGGSFRQNKGNLAPLPLQLLGSRLKTSVSARDLELERELQGLESISSQQQQRQQLLHEISCASPSSWNKDYGRIGDMTPTNLNDVFGSFDSSLLSQMPALSPKVSTTTTQCQSPTSIQTRHSMNQLRSSYPSNFSSSSLRKPPSTYGFDTSGAVAAAVMNSRAATFGKRSQSFIDRRAVSHQPNFSTVASPVASVQTNLSDWSSPDGKLDWGFNRGEMNKLKKSVSFGLRSGLPSPTTSTNVEESDVSWVHSLVKDVSSVGAGLYTSDQKHAGTETLPSWARQLRMEKQQTVA